MQFNSRRLKKIANIACLKPNTYQEQIRYCQSYKSRALGRGGGAYHCVGPVSLQYYRARVDFFLNLHAKLFSPI